MPQPRRLELRDIDAFCTLRRMALADAPWAFLASPEDDIGSDPDRLAAKLAEPENVVLVIEDEHETGQFVACAGLARETSPKLRHRAFIWGVYTAPTVRRRGCGRAVIEAAIDIARGWQGVEVVYLAVSSNAPEAQALYEAVGFEAWGREPDLVRIGDSTYDEIHMILHL